VPTYTCIPFFVAGLLPIYYKYTWTSLYMWRDPVTVVWLVEHLHSFTWVMTHSHESCPIHKSHDSFTRDVTPRILVLYFSPADGTGTCLTWLSGMRLTWLCSESLGICLSDSHATHCILVLHFNRVDVVGTCLTWLKVVCVSQDSAVSHSICRPWLCHNSHHSVQTHPQVTWLIYT